MEACIGFAGTIHHCVHWFSLMCLCVLAVCSLVHSPIEALVDIYRWKNSGVNGGGGV